MKKSDALSELITSLTMSEKRYFKLFAQRQAEGNNKKYLRLFDIIEGIEEHEKGSLEKALSVEGIYHKHLAADKNYLYGLLMRSLSTFHSSRSVSLKVKEIIHQVEILYEKSLYEQCISLIKKGKKAANTYDLYPLYIELANWEQKVFIQLEKVEAMTDSLTDAAEHLARMDNMNAFMQLYYQMYELAQRIPRIRSSEEREELEEFISHPFLKNESIARSFQAKLQYWKIYSLYHQSTGNSDRELESYQKLLALMDSNDKYAQEFPFEYLTIYSRILSIMRYAPDQDFERVMLEVQFFPKRIKKSRKNVELRIYAETYHNRIRRNIYFGRLEDALQALDEQKAFIDRYRTQFAEGEVLEFEYLFAYIYELNGEHKKALSLVNRLLNESSDKLRRDIQSYLRILNLVIHYELENYTVMKYAADRSYRFMKRKRLLHSTERSLLKLFQRLSRMEGMSLRNINETLRSFRKQMEELFKDPYERESLEYFDILSWIDAQLWGISFPEARQRALEAQAKH